MKKSKKGIAWMMGICFALCSLFAVSAVHGSGRTEAAAAGETATLYQLAPESASLLQSYVIRTQNNKLIVLDGGIDGDGLEREPYMPAALRAIAGVSDGEYFDVEAWFLSHAHKDHFNELAKMLNRYSSDSNYRINHFYFDFPDFGSSSYPSNTNDSEKLEYLKTGFTNYAAVNGISVPEGSTYYEELNGSVINATTIAAGQDIVIDGVRLEIMQTYVASDGTDINNNSLVIRAWVGGQSVLFLSDLGSAGGARLLAKYGENLKSDIVQMAHHGQAGVRQPVYDAINAPVHLWTTPLWVWNDPGAYEIETNREWVNGGRDFTKANASNLVSCLYPAYPAVSTKASEWAKVIDKMSISLPYTVMRDVFSEIGDGWLAAAPVEGTVSDGEYGMTYENEGAFKLMSDRTVWADRFGVAFRADAEDTTGLRLIVSSEQDVWYTEAEHSLAIELRPVKEDGMVVSTDILLYSGEQKLGEYETVMFNWTADHSYSTNYVYLAKQNGKWVLNVNDEIIETDADSALNTAVAAFTDACGYYQLENLGGHAAVTHIGIQYGMPVNSAEFPHSGFAKGPVLESPRWTAVDGNEVAGWTPEYGAPYTIKSSIEIPLNGFHMKLRIAHGEGASAVMIAMTSLYGGADWYAGTYSFVFRIQWDPSFQGNEANVQLMIYHPKTEDLHEEPIKLTAKIADFSWYKGTDFEVSRTRGVWGITVDGKAIFENKMSTEGKTVDDYLKFLLPYYEGGNGYLQVWEPGGLPDDTVSNTGYVIEELKRGAVNAAPELEPEVLSEIVGKDYVVGEAVKIDLKQLFSDADGDTLTFFATKGTVGQDGVWTYETSAPELLFVTFTASDGSKSVQKRVALTIGAETETKPSGGCGSEVAAGSAWLVAAAGAGLLLVRKKKDSEDNREEK